MTKMYTIDQMVSERDNKPIGTLHREHVKFREANPDRKLDIVYHDEQIPIPTTYRVELPSGEDVDPKWINLGGSFLSDKWLKIFQKSGSFNDMTGVEWEYRSYKNPRRNGDPEPVIVKDGGGKEWRSSKELRLTMGVIPPKTGYSGRMRHHDSDEYDYLWRVKDGLARFTDIGRKIDLTWGEKWTTKFGSKPVRDIWQEELRLGKWPFFDDNASESKVLKGDNWRDVVEAHLCYFTEKATVILRKMRDDIPFDEAVAVAMHAIMEFALKLHDKGEDLKSRFATAAFSEVQNYISEAIADKDIIRSKSRQKLEDKRNLNDLIRDLKRELGKTPILEEIMERSGFGNRRLDSTFRIFDFNVGKHREMNDEEMLYTVMDEHLTERQAQVLELNFGLGGQTKMSLNRVSEELGISYDTAQKDRTKAIQIIKREIGFKYENKS